jgi:hypothetical protein
MTQFLAYHFLTTTRTHSINNYLKIDKPMRSRYRHLLIKKQQMEEAIIFIIGYQMTSLSANLPGMEFPF